MAPAVQIGRGCAFCRVLNTAHTPPSRRCVSFRAPRASARALATFWHEAKSCALWRGSALSVAMLRIGRILGGRGGDGQGCHGPLTVPKRGHRAHSSCKIRFKQWACPWRTVPPPAKRVMPTWHSNRCLRLACSDFSQPFRSCLVTFHRPDMIRGRKGRCQPDCLEAQICVVGETSMQRQTCPAAPSIKWFPNRQNRTIRLPEVRIPSANGVLRIVCGDSQRDVVRCQPSAACATGLGPTTPWPPVCFPSLRLCCAQLMWPHSSPPVLSLQSRGRPPLSLQGCSPLSTFRTRRSLVLKARAPSE